jgi:hypothetical protein
VAYIAGQMLKEPVIAERRLQHGGILSNDVRSLRTEHLAQSVSSQTQKLLGQERSPPMIHDGPCFGVQRRHAFSHSRLLTIPITIPTTADQ